MVGMVQVGVSAITEMFVAQILYLRSAAKERCQGRDDHHLRVAPYAKLALCWRLSAQGTS
eukprot:2314972-Pleurochrysis_carterae.AAC.1